LSKQIRDLEEELGVNLFNRTTRRVELTSLGFDLLPEARRILEQVQISFERFEALATGLRNRFRLGILSLEVSLIWRKDTLIRWCSELAKSLSSNLDRGT
jgi:DNA-binding transcriptional LysR family regulator